MGSQPYLLRRRSLSRGASLLKTRPCLFSGASLSSGRPWSSGAELRWETPSVRGRTRSSSTTPQGTDRKQCAAFSAVTLSSLHGFSLRSLLPLAHLCCWQELMWSIEVDACGCALSTCERFDQHLSLASTTVNTRKKYRRTAMTRDTECESHPGATHFYLSLYVVKK